MATSQTTAQALMALVRQRAYQPANGGPSDTAVLRDLNAELLTYVGPFLMTIGEEFFVAPLIFTTESGQSEYDIPADSIGAKLRDVQTRADDGVTWVSIAHTEPERASAYARQTGKPVAYYLRGDKIALLPKPGSGAYPMRLMYYRRPREIVNSGYAVASMVSPVSFGTYTVTVPDTSGMVSGDFDILDSATYARIAEALPGTVATGTTITFAAANLDADQIAALEAATGDLFIGTGLSPAADVPPEAAVLLAQRVATIELQEAADPRAAQAFSELERVRATLQQLFAPRASGRPRKVVNQTGPGWGFRGPWGFRGWPGS